MILPLNPRKKTHKEILEMNSLLIGIQQSQSILEFQKNVINQKLRALYDKEGIKADVECDTINQELKY